MLIFAGCALLRPVGLGPCLPATDDGAPQPCGGWVVLPPGGHVRTPQQKAPSSKAPGPAAPSANAPGGIGAPSAAGARWRACPRDLWLTLSDADMVRLEVLEGPPR
jgi:hypothetical protein